MTTTSTRLLDSLRIAAPSKKQMLLKPAPVENARLQREGSFDNALSAARQTHDPAPIKQNSPSPAKSSDPSSSADATPKAGHRTKTKTKTKDATKESPSPPSNESGEQVDESADEGATTDDAPAAKTTDTPSPQADAATNLQAVTLAMAATTPPAAAVPPIPISTEAASTDTVTNKAPGNAPEPTASAAGTKAKPTPPSDATPEAETASPSAGKVEKPPASVQSKNHPASSAPDPTAKNHAVATSASTQPAQPLPDSVEAPESDAPATPTPFKSTAKAAPTPKPGDPTTNIPATTDAPNATATSAATSTTAALVTAVVSDAAKVPAHNAPPESAAIKNDSSAISTSLSAGAPSPVKLASSPGATSATPAQDSPASDAANTFDQIVLGLRGKIDARNGKAEIRLDPPNLGTVRVSLNLQNGSLTAQFQSSSQQVRDLLQSNMEKLKTTLESQGIAVDKLAVDSAGAKVPAPVSAASVSTNAAANDGRSAGQYHSQGGEQKRSTRDPSSFSKIWRDVSDAAPIDLVA